MVFLASGKEISKLPRKLGLLLRPNFKTNSNPCLSLLPLLSLRDFRLWRFALQLVGQRFVLAVFTAGTDQIRMVVFESFDYQGGFVVRNRGHVSILSFRANMRYAAHGHKHDDRPAKARVRQ